MSASLPTNGEYLIVSVLFALYLALRLNIIPKIGGRRNSEIFLLVFLCGAISVNIGVHYRTVQRGHSVDKVLYAETLRNVSQVLPEGTHVGYISDIEKSDRREWLVRFFGTKYAVAPWVLDEGTVPNWVIVNSAAYDPRLIPDDMVLVRDFGDGLRLFRRKEE